MLGFWLGRSLDWKKDFRQMAEWLDRSELVYDLVGSKDLEMGTRMAFERGGAEMR